MDAYDVDVGPQEVLTSSPRGWISTWKLHTWHPNISLGEGGAETCRNVDRHLLARRLYSKKVAKTPLKQGLHSLDTLSPLHLLKLQPHPDLLHILG